MKAVLSVVAVLLTVAVLAVNAQNGVHFSNVNMLNAGPMPIGGGCSREIDSSSFLFFGGAIEFTVTSDGENSFFNNLWKFTYDETQNSGYWTQLSPAGVAPTPRAFCTMDVVTDANGNKHACVLGGARFTGFAIEAIPEDYFFCYDITNNAWVDYSSVSGGPGPRAGAVGRSLGGDFYVTGGVRPHPIFFFEFLNDLYKFNIDTQSWTTLPGGVYYPRFDFRGEFLRKSAADPWKLYIYSGETILPDFSFGYVNDTWEYNVNTGAWTLITNQTPSPNRQGSCISRSADRKRLVIYGGDQDGFSQNCEEQEFRKNVSNQVWEFSALTGSWTLRNPVSGSLTPIPLKRHECVSFGNNMLAFSGWDFFCPTTSSHVQSHFMDMYKFN